MICSNCKKNQANVFYKQNINGKKTEYNLCSECAEKLQNEGKLEFNIPDPFEISDPFENFGSFFGLKPFFSSPALSSGRKQNGQKKCTLCGSTFEDLVNSGKIGCAECYKTFENELRPTIENIHGKEKYVGRKPLRFAEKESAESKIASLRKEMKKAISEENFERAAELRDEIRKTEGKNANA